MASIGKMVKDRLRGSVSALQNLPLIKEKNDLQTSLDQGSKVQQMKNSRERAKRQGLSNR